MENDNEAAGLITQVISRWRDWCEARRQRSEVTALTQEELGELAADCGVSPADLVIAVKAGRHGADELGQLAEALGIDFRRLENANYFNDMQRVCAGCEVKKRCRRALAMGIAPVTYDAYCPNAVTLAELEQVQNMLQPFPNR